MTHDAFTDSNTHRDSRPILSIRNGKLILLQIHQLHLVLGHPVLVLGLEGELGRVGTDPGGGDGDDVVLGGAPEHLGHALHVHAK